MVPLKAQEADIGVPRVFLVGTDAISGWQVLLAKPFVQIGKTSHTVAQWAADSYTPAVCPLGLFSV